ncbi:GNAT family N-acetyltransferase [Devosia chinhatensis]|uniref:N-acetyltransferase domain-containing protein n=1 Tax=Devosia chinhatensis TaxID=429727 RepID=A0A0F5FKT6_9HYPH|nr:GNAT family N-acetyltransferase [Devosia chinhatensis]KKB09160.1 hypothetical protein VE26_03955 [Devosia chinhatensis]
MVILRPYSPLDLDALYTICVKTGDSGRDATPLHNDLDLIGHIYAAPYGVLEPENVFVAEDENGVGGYVVGTLDTDRFADRLDTEWWPALQARYASADDMTEADQGRIGAIMQPHRSPEDLVRDYPAHIHMNLLPHLRGQRVGSRLLGLWIDQARAKGVTGIHLGASARNEGGMAFWSRSGFTRLREDGAVWFGMKL